MPGCMPPSRSLLHCAAGDTQGGRGQHIDISLLDCQIAALGHRILSYFVSGRVPLRNGNVPPGTSMARTIQCRDAWITISADADNEFPVFCRVLGRPELAADPRFSDQAGRSRNIDALLAEIEPIMRSRDAAAWIDDLSEARIICSPIYTIDQMLGDPQVVERGLAQTVDHPVLGETPIIGNPIRMSETRLDHHTAPPLLGSSTDDVLRDFLGLSPDRIDALRAAKVI